MAFILFIWFVTILASICTFYCTEFVFDCSVYTNNQLIVIGWGVSLFIHIMVRFKRSISDILCFFTSCLVYGLIYYLFVNRQLVFKYVVDETFKIKKPVNDDIFVYYVMSSTKKEVKIIDIKSEFDIFNSKVKSAIENRSKDGCLVIEHDFTDIFLENVFEYTSFCNYMDAIHFSRFGTKLCFVLKVPVTYVKKIGQVDLSESKKTHTNNIKHTEDGSPNTNDLRFQLNSELKTKIEERNKKKSDND
ncbi:hypothetical protein P3W45_001473 [Vairimorpha bombi]